MQHRSRRRVARLATASLAATLLVGAVPAAADELPSDDLIAAYEFADAADGTVHDSSGNGQHGTIAGSPAGNPGSMTFTGSNHVVLPDGLLAGRSAATVVVETRPTAAALTGNVFLWTMGGTGDDGTGQFFVQPATPRAALSATDWTAEERATSPTRLRADVWQSVAATVEPNGDGTTSTLRLFVDGVLVAENAAATTGLADLTTHSNNLLGASAYAADKRYTGEVSAARVYGSALSAQQLGRIADADAATVAQEAIEGIDLDDLTAVTTDLSLPTAGGITWQTSDPAVVEADGTVHRGTEPASATLTATATVRGHTSPGRDFEVTVLPVGTADVEADLATIVLPHQDDVRGNLTLPTVGVVHGSALTWQSSEPGTISDAPVGAKAAGVVTRPAAGTGPVQVTLTATATRADSAATREFVVTVAETPADLDTDYTAGYLWTHFAVSGGYEKIFLGHSEDGLHWQKLNGNQPVLANLAGDLGVRDPHLVRAPEGDRYWVIGTDLHAEGGGAGGSGWDQYGASQNLVVWESADLVTWSDQRIVFAGFDHAGCVWAPEAIYDEATGEYLVYWAARDQRDHGTNDWALRMYLTRTRDFVTFTEPVVWLDENDPTSAADGPNIIDSTLVRDGDTYYRFSTSDWNTVVDTSTSLDGPWERKIARGTHGQHGLGSIEGITSYQLPDGRWAVMGDNGGYSAYVTDDLAGLQFTRLGTGSGADQVSFDQTFRHGSVLRLSAAEERRLLAAYGDGVRPPGTTEDGQILRYDFEDGAGTVVRDVTGNGHDAMVVGGGTWADGGLRLDGTDDYVDLPDNLLAGTEDLTVEAQVVIDPGQRTPYFIWGLGNTVNGTGEGYLFTTGDSYRTSLAMGDYRTEQTVGTGAALPRGEAVHLVYTLSGDTATLYLNGVQVASSSAVTNTPGAIGGGVTTANYLGRSLYDADRRMSGRFEQFALWNRALSSAEVLDLSGNQAALAGVSLAEEAALKLAPMVDEAGRTVTFAVQPGTDLTALTPTFAVASGVQASPASGTAVDLSEPVTYTLTASDGSSAQWTMRALVSNSPVLPGLYADPNIVVFGGTYYIYATSDGYPGWGGQEFYVWKSTDLVTWERAAEPFLRLDGADGNVPWATGNAWAPTIIERDGRYYFYFSGHNPTYDRKTIGVAVADSPDGPFVAQPEAMILNNEAVTSGQAIDPAAFHDPETGKYFLFWGNGSPVYAELSDDMLSIKQDTIARQSGLTDYREGTFVNYRDGVYHLTYSIDDTGSENYRVGYATADSVHGPWTAHGVVLEKDLALGIKGPGHNSVVQVPGTDDWYMAYHRFAMPDGNGNNRETTIDRVTFDPDTGLMNRVTPTLESVPAQTVPDPEPLVVTVEGNPVVGETLTAEAGDPWRATGHQWTRDGAPIDGATAAAYQATAADEGTVLAVTVDAAKWLWPDATGTAEVGVVTAAPQPVVEVTVTGPEPNAAGWRTGPVRVDLALHEAGAGTIEYRVGEGAWQPVSGPIVVDAQGVTVLEYRVIDGGGPVDGAQGSVRFLIDSEAPTLVPALDPPSGLGTPDTPVRLAVTATDATSGVVGVEYRVGTGPWAALPAGGVVFDAVGSFPVEYRATDTAGNVATGRTVVTISAPGAPTGRLSLAASTVTAGDTLDVTGDGFEPGEDVTLVLHSAPVHLATARADRTGAVSATVTIPADTVAGSHTLRAAGSRSGVLASAELTVVAPAEGTGPGGDAAGPGADAGTLAVTGTAVGVLLLLTLGTIGFGTLLRRRTDAARASGRPGSA